MPVSNDVIESPVLDILPELIAIGQGSRFVYMNPAGARMLGHDDPSVLVGVEPTALAHGDDRAKMEGRLQRALEQREAAPPVVLRMRRSDGSYATLESRGVPSTYANRPAMVVIARDLEEARAFDATRSALRETEAMFRSVVESANDAIVIADASGNIMLANPAVHEIFGWGPDELVGLSLERLMPPEIREAHSRMLALAASGSPPATMLGRPRELVGIRKDGTEVRIEITLSAWDGSKGRIFGAVIRDVSARHALERQREEFLASVSHELRTPLNLVTAALDLLREAPLPPERRERMLEIAAANTDRLARMVGDMLEAQVILAGRLQLLRQPLHVEEVVERAAELAGPSFARVGKTIVTRTHHCELEIDGDRVTQVLLNLLDNARKVSPDGGVVEVEQDLDERGAIVRVLDRGPGVPAAAREAIFERFVQLPAERKSGRGVGLGLPVCRAIVEAHGGRIWVEERPGGGAIFVVTLPAPREPSV